MIAYLKQLWRVLTIYRIIIRYGLDELLLTSQFNPSLKILLYLTPGYWLRPKNMPRGMRIRLALEELGPIFVKFGQILSTRRDLLPDDIAIELALLQDHVAPFPLAEALRTLQTTYGKPLNQVFAHFEPEPIAAASIAQVHAATLYNGTSVVVKILRPRIRERIHNDVALLYTLARLTAHYWREGRRLRPTEVVAEFERSLESELDLMQEASNCSQLKRNFDTSPLLYVPEVYWDYTDRNVIVMERISGVPISEIAELQRRHVNLAFLAEAGVEIFFTQVFRDNFFHADMHPGNIFVDTTNPQKPYYIAVDFGIMGSLTRKDQHYLAENFLAFFRRDYRRVAELHVHSGWVPSGTKVEEFETAIRSVCEPIFDKPLKEISFGIVLLRLFQTARRFNMEIQPQLVLLQKTLLNIEGLGRQLYPDLDLWKTARPYLEVWMRERVGFTAFLKGVWDNLPPVMDKLPQLPLMLYDALQQQQQQAIHFQQISLEIKQLRQDLSTQRQQSGLLTTGSALIICATLILALDVRIQWGLPLLGILLGTTGATLLLIAWLNSGEK